jgi:hypothetical protein
MTELLHAEIAKVESLVQAGVGLLALVMIVAVWVRTKAFVPTLGAVVFGAVVTWSVHNVAFLQSKVDQEFSSLPAVVVDADHLARA